MNREIWGEGVSGPRRWPRTVAAAFACATLAIVTIAGTTRLMFDVANWRASIHAARAIGRDAQRPDGETAGAIFALTRDAQESIDVLLRIAERDGPSGVRARASLENLRRRLER